MRPHGPGPVLGDVEARAHGVLEPRHHVAAEDARGEVDLDVELAELRLEVGVGDRLQRRRVDHCRIAGLVGEVELDLEPERARLGIEARLGEHAGEHVEAGADLAAVALPVLAGEHASRDFLAHIAIIPEAARACRMSGLRLRGPRRRLAAVCETCAVSDSDLLDHGRRIAELERKVSELYKRLGQAEPSGFADDSGFSTPASVTAAEDPRVVELLQAGKQIQAIKLYRELTGVGLAEAKDAVDQLAAMHRPTG
jgi:hypothetical protein